jgi:LDH2 family malate/lactate/ureidoglycolate dehydrogenase
MAQVHLDALAAFCQGALGAMGLDADDARIVTASIVHAHAHGKGTHGAGRLAIYERKLREGLMQAQTPMHELRSAPAMALLDAGHGFGQVAAVRGMARACDMAAIAGIAVVGIRHSNSFGAAGFVAQVAVDRNMAGLVFTNAGPAIAPTGGRRALWGTNPIAFGCPAGADQPPILLDMATAAVARSKIRQAAQSAEPIPLGWALDPAGMPTTDATAALAGSMVPMGGPKGSGLAMMVDILAGMLTGSGFAGTARALDHPDRKSDVGHMLIAIDISRFMSAADYGAAISELVAATKATGAAGEVFLPGERGARYMDGRNGQVPLSPAVLKRLEAVAHRLGLALPPLST